MPVGVSLVDDNRNILFDLDKPNLQVIAAHGGQVLEEMEINHKELTY